MEGQYGRGIHEPLGGEEGAELREKVQSIRAWGARQRSIWGGGGAHSVWGGANAAKRGKTEAGELHRSSEKALEKNPKYKTADIQGSF